MDVPAPPQFRIRSLLTLMALIAVALACGRTLGSGAFAAVGLALTLAWIGMWLLMALDGRSPGVVLLGLLLFMAVMLGGMGLIMLTIIAFDGLG